MCERYNEKANPYTSARIPGERRRQVSSAVARAIEDKIQKEMDRYPGVTRSFVIANALAFTFGVKIDSYK